MAKHTSLACLQPLRLAALCLSGLLFLAPARATDVVQQAQFLADAYANEAIASGYAVGLAIGVVKDGRTIVRSTYGAANAQTGAPVTPSTLFQIASMTKVFTTNILGQDVAAGRLPNGLDTKFSQLTRPFGAYMPSNALTKSVTLKELGDFSAGLPSYNFCWEYNLPSCSPGWGDINYYPIVQTAGVDNGDSFMGFLQKNALKDYTKCDSNGVCPNLQTLPGPYVYSNYSTALLGMLLGSWGMAIDQHAIDRWFSRVQHEILTPLAMTSTFLNVPNAEMGRMAHGYTPAIVRPTVKNGGIESLRLDANNPGPVFSNGPPSVTITGGGGAGAAFTANLVTDPTNVNFGMIKNFTRTNAGHGYQPPIVVTIADPTGSGALVEPVVSQGSIVAFKVTGTGGAYSHPTIAISGGGGVGAKATARVWNGSIIAVIVDNGGSGYADPLKILIDSGDGILNNTVSVFAPAGALVSSLDDMLTFATAALGESSVGGRQIPRLIAQGFGNAEQYYNCNDDSALPPPPASSCTFFTGLNWEMFTPDTDNGVPLLILKNGNYTGYTSEMDFVPSQRLGVVVLANSSATAAAGFDIADRIAEDIAYNVIFAAPLSQPVLRELVNDTAQPQTVTFVADFGQPIDTGYFGVDFGDGTRGQFHLAPAGIACINPGCNEARYKASHTYSSAGQFNAAITTPLCQTPPTAAPRCLPVASTSVTIPMAAAASDAGGVPARISMSQPPEAQGQIAAAPVLAPLTVPQNNVAAHGSKLAGFTSVDRAELISLNVDDQSVAEFLEGLRLQFGVDYSSRVGLDRRVSGPFRGSLTDIIAKALADYVYVVEGDARPTRIHIEAERQSQNAAEDGSR